MNETGRNFRDFWGNKERAYSGVIVQTLALWPKFRSFFLQKVHERNPDALSKGVLADVGEDTVCVEARTERSFGDCGRIDIYLDIADRLLLAFENKAWIGLRPRQLLDYDQWLATQKRPYVLVFFAPSRHQISSSERPTSAGFVPLSYKVLIQWIKQFRQVVDVLSPFEQDYLKALTNFAEDLEMKPLTKNELAALGSAGAFREAKEKLRKLVGQFGDPAGKTGDNYLLFGEPVFEGNRAFCRV